MSFTAGVFSINTTGQPVVTGTVISSTVFNALTADLASGLSTCVLKDGTQTITASIPMAGFKLTGLGSGTAAADSATLSQVQSGVVSYLTAVAGTNTITATGSPIPAYTIGQRFTFIPAVTNTGATTLNISAVGAGAVQWVGAALTGGELVAGTPVTVLVTAATPVFEIINATQFPDTRALVVGGTDPTKKVRLEVDGLTTATTRVVTVPDRNITINPVAGTTLTKNPYATTSTTTQAHGLGAVPDYLRVRATCLTNDAGYTAGQILDLGAAGFQDINSGGGKGINITYDATNVVLVTGDTLPNLVNPSTGASGTIVAANWRIDIVPYSFT